MEVNLVPRVARDRPNPSWVVRKVTNKMPERKLLLEIWEDFGESGESLPALHYGGPLGNEGRAQLSPRAQLVATIWASSHFESMTKYYELMGWGQYTTDQLWDYQPYPEEWVIEQEKARLAE